MKLINSKWCFGINMLLFECDCGNKFWHKVKVDKIYAICPKCRRFEDNFIIKEKRVHNENNRY